MNSLSEILVKIDNFVWGPAMLILLMGTGIFLTLRTHFLPWKNLFYAIKCSFSSDSLSNQKGEGDISPFSSLTTSLAATIGTGNIVGVATAITAGGPGAILWMLISSAFGMSTKLGECLLAVKYRETNSHGEMCGGPMYTIKKAMHNSPSGKVLAWLFALFAVTASFGIGNMTQSNSISGALQIAFQIPEPVTGIVVTLLAFIILVGGIKNISKVSQILIPFMSAAYIIMGVLVILGNIENLIPSILLIIKSAFCVQAIGGGLCGHITASAFEAMRSGIARGCFSNEAGMGSAAISAAAASTDSAAKQGYISMTGVFWDTIVVCTITGLCIVCSGSLGITDPSTGQSYDGAALTMAAFETVLGNTGGILVCIGIALFAFSTILGWEYFGEKAFEYLTHTRRYNYAYRIVFCLIVYIGATMCLTPVWSFSDIANALMCIPNLISLLLLNKEIVKVLTDFEKHK